MGARRPDLIQCRLVSLASFAWRLAKDFFHPFCHLILVLESVFSFSLSNPGIGQSGVGQ